MHKMDIQMDTLFEFIKQNWLLFLIALIVLLVIISFVKTMIKWALVVVIVAGVAVYSGVTWKDIDQVVTTVKDETVAKLKDQAIQAMKDEASKATYERNKDGSYTVKTPSLELKGQAGSTKVHVSLGGVSLGEWESTEMIRQFIEGAKK
ncbi:ATPase [Paenibacillus assamensis]|uniref:ATPase n=1 Tax=Paenibacillus assamensis TaxID=311244 RepID=UPI00316ABC17